MVTFEDPVPMLEQVRLMALPVVSDGGTDYVVDFQMRYFREADRLRVCVPFESPIGRCIARQIAEVRS